MAGGTGDDDLRGEDGNDSLDGGVGDDRLEGGDGSDSLMGNVGDDNLKGGRDDDSLHGGQGRDELSGGDGDDDLHGGSAADELHGGRGADTFFIASPAEGGDTIFDFRPGDDLITLDVDVPAVQVAFVGFEDGVDTVPASGAALIYSDATGLLSWDPTGGSASDQVLVATLIGSPGLERADVLLV
jgi:Ca2+-binding RTX toxin-like protein